MVAVERGYISFPIGNDQGAIVQLSLEELKKKPLDEIVRVLQLEVVPLKYWRRVALEYYRFGQMDNFVKLLKEGTTTDEDDFMDAYNDQSNEMQVMMTILAQYHITQAAVGKDVDENLRQAQKLFSRAENLDPKNPPSVMIGKGHFHLTKYKLQKKKEDLDEAHELFKKASESSETTIASQIGLAKIYWYQNKFEECLNENRKVLMQLQHKGQSDMTQIRFTIAQCYFKLNRRDAAMEALEVVLNTAHDSEPLKLDAYCILAELKSNKSNQSDEAFELLKKALAIDQTHPLVQCQLANHCFFLGENEKAAKFLSYVTDKAEGESGKANATFQRGRLAHVKGDMLNAHRSYEAAIKMQPNMPLALYGLAQVLYAQDRINESYNALEKVRRLHPQNYDVLKFMAYLLSLQDRKQRAIESVEKLLRMNPADEDLYLMSASLHENTNLTLALEHYEKYVSIAEAPTAEVYNNIAALMQVKNRWADAKKMYDLAIIAEPKSNEQKALQITVRFNLARWHEQKPDPQNDIAMEMYQQIIDDCPGYADARIALGLIYYHRQNYDKALSLFEDAMNIDDKNDDATLLKAMAFQKKDHLETAIQILVTFDKKTREGNGKPHLYTCVLLGNMFHEKAMVASRLRRQAKGDQRGPDVSRHAEQEAKYLEQALKFFLRALEIDKSMWAAVRGIGIILAHKSKSSVAKALLNKIKKHTSSPTSKVAIHIDLGHLCMESSLERDGSISNKSALQQAIGFYRLAHQGRPTDAQIALYYASALFHGAVAFQDSSLFKDCQEVINAAMISDPSDIRLRFNAATCLMRMAYHFLRDQQRMQLEEHVQQAISMLKSAHRLFQYLQTTRLDIHKNINQYIPNKMGDIKKLKENAEYCKKAVMQCELFMGKLKETRSNREEQMRQAEAERDAKIAEIAKQEKEEAEAKLAADDQKNRAAEALMFEGLQYDLRTQNDEEENAKGSKSKSKSSKSNRHQPVPQDEFIEDDPTLADLGLESSDDEFGEGGTEQALPEEDDESLKRKREDESDDDDFFGDAVVDNKQETRSKRVRIDSDEEGDLFGDAPAQTEQPMTSQPMTEQPMTSQPQTAQPDDDDMQQQTAQPGDVAEDEIDLDEIDDDMIDEPVEGEVTLDQTQENVLPASTQVQFDDEELF